MSQTNERFYQIHNFPLVSTDFPEAPMGKRKVFGRETYCQLQWHLFLHKTNMPKLCWMWVVMKFHRAPCSTTFLQPPSLDFRRVRKDFQPFLFSVTRKPSCRSWQSVGFQSPLGKPCDSGDGFGLPSGHRAYFGNWINCPVVAQL